MLAPVTSQTEHNYFDNITVELLKRDETYPERSLVTFQATSEILDVPAGKELSHAFKFYVGPKRDELMASFNAGDLMQFGWFSWFSRQMLWVMSTLHDTAGFPYWLAIIVLTVIVRGAMYPMSRRQALSMKHLKDMQPAMTELQLKYKDDKEKLALAQLQLMKEHGVSPLMGCMPFFLIMLQMPIFIGLYNALANAIELRRAPFLYITDLASPDKMFQLPFNIPFLGTDFNLLPILTIILFLVQQKMYMPPATTDEQKVQQSMMTYMMVFMGFMFYKVPAGLCVYFIASSLWGLVERRILDWHDNAIEKRKANKMENLKKDRVIIETDDFTRKEVTAEKSWLRNLFETVDKAANPNDYGAKQYSKQENENKNKNKS
jgi:YidC/Oxa1 family membrane protein insertase